MSLTFDIQKRDFSRYLQPPKLNYIVEKYRKSAIGGCRSARIYAEGSKESLFDLVELLRCPIQIYNEKHEIQWWGFISDVTVRWRAIEYGISIDTMQNKIAVAYTFGGRRYTTAYSTDSTSAAEYGTKEILLSQSDKSEGLALQFRDTELARHKYPIAINHFSSGEAGSAVIECRGWFDTFDWRYYSNDAGQEAYEVPGDAQREIGEDDRPICAQSFQLLSAAGWNASDIWLSVWKYGNPVDNFLMDLCSDTGGSAGVSLGQVALAGASMQTSSLWTKFSLPADVSLAIATTYHIKCSRSGAVDINNYYLVDTCTDAGYPRGVFKLYSTPLASWVQRDRYGDMLFKVVGDQATSTQIATLVTNVGEFLTGTNVETASGIETAQYRYGDTTAMTELLDLLQTGTSNDRRYLAEVTPGRVLRVYEEPAKPALDDAYAVDADSVLFSPYGNKVLPSECTVGKWCRLRDVIPASMDISKILDPGLFFIEEAEFDAEKNRYNILRAATEQDVFRMEIEQG